MESVVCAWDENYETEDLKTRLIMLDVMLTHGANPQHMTKQMIHSEYLRKSIKDIHHAFIALILYILTHRGI